MPSGGVATTAGSFWNEEIETLSEGDRRRHEDERFRRRDAARVRGRARLFPIARDPERFKAFVDRKRGEVADDLARGSHVGGFRRRPGALDEHDPE